MINVLRILTTLYLFVFTLYGFFIGTVANAGFFGSEPSRDMKDGGVLFLIIAMLSITMMIIIWIFRKNSEVLYFTAFIYAFLVLAFSILGSFLFKQDWSNEEPLFSYMLGVNGFYMPLYLNILIALLLLSCLAYLTKRQYPI